MIQRFLKKSNSKRNRSLQVGLGMIKALVKNKRTVVVFRLREMRCDLYGAIFYDSIQHYYMNRIKKESQQNMNNQNMIKKVLGVFQQIDKVENVPKTHIFDLVKLFNTNPKGFQIAFQLAYLKIFKIFHEKANRKMPLKYEQLANLFFQ